MALKFGGGAPKNQMQTALINRPGGFVNGKKNKKVKM